MDSAASPLKTAWDRLGREMTVAQLSRSALSTAAFGDAGSRSTINRVMRELLGLNEKDRRKLARSGDQMVFARAPERLRGVKAGEVVCLIACHPSIPKITARGDAIRALSRTADGVVEFEPLLTAPDGAASFGTALDPADAREDALLRDLAAQGSFEIFFADERTGSPLGRRALRLP